MKKKEIVRKICSILYHLTGHWFPDSYYYLNISSISIHITWGLRYRRFLASKIIIECGKEINVERYASFNRNIKIGDYSGIGFRCHIPGDTVIGKNVMMGPEVVMYSRNHKIERTDIPMCLQGFSEVKPIVIGNDVWIGRRAIILPGVVIGDGCVIGAGTVVAKSIPPYSVVVGNPARIVRNRKNDC